MNHELKKMLPFLEEEEIDKVAGKVMESGAEEWKGLRLNDLFPFMSTETIDKMFLETVDAGKSFSQFLPFISEEIMHEIVEEIVTRKREMNLDFMYPFMSDEDIKKVFYFYLDNFEL